MAVSTTTKSRASLPMLRSSRTRQYREMICTRVAPSTPVPASRQTLFPSQHPKESRSLRSPSQRASFCGPAAQEGVPRSWPVVQRNRDPYPNPLLCLNRPFHSRVLFLSLLLRCRMATNVVRPQRQTELRLRLRRPLRPHHHPHSPKNRDIKLCMILRANRLAN